MLHEKRQGTAHQLRTAARKLTFWQGELQTSGGQFACRVVDMSDGGAQIRIAHKTGDSFPLLTQGSITLVIPRLGRFAGSIVWQRGAAIGLSLSPHSSETTSGRAAGAMGSTGATPQSDADRQNDALSDAISGIDPLLVALLARLPPGGREWPLLERVKWLQAAAGVFDLIYAREGGIKIEPDSTRDETG